MLTTYCNFQKHNNNAYRYNEFHKMMKNEKVLEKVSQSIYKMYKSKFAPKKHTVLKVQDFMDCL